MASRTAFQTGWATTSPDSFEGNRRSSTSKGEYTTAAPGPSGRGAADGAEGRRTVGRGGVHRPPRLDPRQQGCAQGLVQTVLGGGGRQGRRPETDATETVAELPATKEGEKVKLDRSPEATRAPRRPGARSGTAVGRPSVKSVDDLTEGKLRQLYSAYSTAKKRCGEKVDLGFNDMARSLKKQVPQLLKTTGAKEIEFKVVIKRGHAVLKAVPKRK